MTEQLEETYSDRLLAFTLPERDVRGRVVRLDGVLETILSAHDYPDPIRDLLAEALVFAALAGGLLKGEGSQLTIQAQTDEGIVQLLVCDYRDGELRGYVQFDEDRLGQAGNDTSLETLFGKGFLAVTFDLATNGQRYQGIVPLEGNSITAAFEAYFGQSEQVPTLIRVSVDSNSGRPTAGGILLQHLAEGEEGRERLHVRMDHPEWEHIAIIADTVRPDELVDQSLSLEALLWRLFHEENEIRVEQGAPLTRGCRCTTVHFETVLARFPSEERAKMRNDDGVIMVDCAFCSRLFPIQD
ncbi:molecular chaperone Hsp33 [Croceicoccus estronivorus]|uniref:Hsp33 family molecular chaperone HslO n=1 Tax=Croceicoccus estronivorus TaxID=1172626 RepID=UPI000831FAE5|nr:Hsp33 family molecular chaperone HslO [Croceicoccus estronivorus]OCC24231.1 molecular chaperone Hsp33 [Croceicoccus estronivorus]